MKKVYKGYVFDTQKIKNVFPEWSNGCNSELDFNDKCGGIYKKKKRYAKTKQIKITLEIEEVGGEDV